MGGSRRGAGADVRENTLWTVNSAKKGGKKAIKDGSNALSREILNAALFPAASGQALPTSGQARSKRAAGSCRGEQAFFKPVTSGMEE